MPIIVAINKIDVATPEQIDGAHLHLFMNSRSTYRFHPSLFHVVAVYEYFHKRKLLSPDITRTNNITKTTKIPPTPEEVRRSDNQ